MRSQGSLQEVTEAKIQQVASSRIVPFSQTPPN